ncbi:MAG: amidohydrolase family protein [Bacteroidia bacterium]|nr:amidohydrolase family protein [Bacteroidia bacterium]MDW8301956.1 amidohydrolase family protein [Bacteroidia bacterium]
MQTISADYIYVGNGEVLKNYAIQVDEKGVIRAILSPQECSERNIQPTFYPGSLCPGFVNAHCHLELSHLKGKIRKNLGLNAFLDALIPLQKYAPSEQEIAKAIVEMAKQGIVAVGDISNTKHTFRIKEKLTTLHIHTFVESFGLHPDKAQERFLQALTLFHELKSEHKSLTPHAPYSVSLPLLKDILDYACGERHILSYHLLESDTERELFEKREGKMYQRLLEWFGDLSFFEPKTNNPVQEWIVHFPFDSAYPKSMIHILFVHNTYLNENELNAILEHFEKPYFVLCPNANLYIENRLPDVDMFVKYKVKVCVGTDSLASNDQLSILAELQTLQQYFPHLDLNRLIVWATLNGAEALYIEDKFGSLEVGKQPGILWLKNTTTHLTEKSEVQRLF